MKLKCVGSSSSGNCYILEDDNEALVLDCGVPVKDIKVALDFNISKIVGAVVTHVHADHNKYSNDISKIGIPVFKPFETMKKKVQYGNFQIYTFPLVHDVPCYGFYIIHPSFGKFLYITDTEYCKYTFSEVNHFLVGANYDDEEAEVEIGLENHVYRGHMSLSTAISFIKANYKENTTKTITLCHLSTNNADGIKFTVILKDNFNCGTHVAYRGLEYRL